MSIVKLETVEKPKYDFPLKEIEVKITNLSKTLSKVSEKIPIIDYGVATLTSRTAEIPFSKEFPSPPMVVAFYILPGKPKKVSPVSVPKVTLPRIPKISVPAPQLPSISIRFSLPRISFKPFEPPEVRYISKIPEISVKLPPVPKITGFSKEYVAKHLPTVKVSIPRVRRPDFRYKAATSCRSAIATRIRSILGEWGYLNWLRDRFVGIFASVAYYLGYAIGAVMNLFWDIVIQPQVNEVQKSLQKTANDVISQVRSALVKLLNDTINRVNSLSLYIGKSLVNFRNYLETSVNAGFKQVIAALNDRINDINTSLSSIGLASSQYANAIAGKLESYFDSYNKAVEGTLNSLIARINDSHKKISSAIAYTVNEAFGVFGGSVNETNEKFAIEVNKSLSSLTSSINALADSILKLAGFYEGRTVLVGEPKNVTKRGFTVKVASPGVKVFWIAVHRGE